MSRKSMTAHLGFRSVSTLLESVISLLNSEEAFDAGSDEELYDEIPCEICGGEGTTYNVYYERHLCRNCEARMVGIPKDLLHPDT